MPKESWVDIEGIRLPPFSQQQSLDEVLARIDRGEFTRVAWINAHCANSARKDEEYRASLERFEFVFNDGIGVELAARMLGRSFPDNLNGTDWIPNILDRLNAAQTGPRRVFLLGATSEALERACRAFQDRWPRLTLVGSRDGFFADASQVVDEIRATGAQIVIVGMGVPRQERFITTNGDSLKEAGALLVMAGGAILDFLGGTVRRAPAAVRHLKLEWVWRLSLEPKRMWRRYLVGNPEFLYHAFRHSRRT